MPAQLKFRETTSDISYGIYTGYANEGIQENGSSL